MQAFAYRHLVPARELLVRVSGPARSRIPWKIPPDDPVKLPAGGTAPVQLFLPFPRLGTQLHLTLSEPPEGIAIQNLSLVRDGVSVLLRADAGKVKPGLKGNLIVEAFLERTANAGDAKKQPANRRQPLGILPAIAFEIVATQ